MVFRPARLLTRTLTTASLALDSPRVVTFPGPDDLLRLATAAPDTATVSLYATNR